MLTHSMTIKLIYRLFHDSLLLGTRAHTYFREVQHAHKYDPERIYPRHNIFDNTQLSTYQYEFFESPFVRPLWTYTNRLIGDMHLQTQVSNLDELFLAIHDLGGQSVLKNIINLNLITLTLKAIWNTYVGQMEKWRTHPILEVKRYMRRKLITSYKTQLRMEIDALPYHIHTIEIHDTYKDYDFKRTTERQKCMLKTYSCNKKRLRKSEAKAYRNTWAQTGLVMIKRTQPPNPADMLDIGPIILIGIPPV